MNKEEFEKALDEALATLKKEMMQKFEGKQEDEFPKDNDNCCKNCIYAREYTGYDDFYCDYYDCGRRAEYYNCENFKLDVRGEEEW